MYSGSGRNRRVIANYTFENGILTIPGSETVAEDFTAITGAYTAVFSTEADYVDIKATFNLYTTLANDDVMLEENNTAGLTFMITPAGAVSSVDKELEKNNFVNATEYTVKAENKSIPYAADKMIKNSGFSFDVVLKDVPSDKTAVLGFSASAVLNAETLGSEARYDAAAASVKTFESMEEGGQVWYRVDGDGFDMLDLKIKSVTPDGTLADLTDKASAGATFSDDKNIIVVYGAMLADSSTVEEGFYVLSPEGEMLLNDGKADGHIKAAWYLEDVAGSGGKPEGGEEGEEDEERTEELKAPVKAESKAPSSTATTNANAATTKGNIVEALEKAIKEFLSDFSLPDGADESISTTFHKGTGKGYQASQLAGFIGSSENNPITLEPMSADKPGLYMFAIDPDTLSAFKGMKIFIRMIVTSLIEVSETGDILAVADDEQNSAGVFVDDNGNILDKVPASGNVNAVAYMDEGVEYTPLITTAAADSDASIGSSSSGCNTVGAFAPVLLLGVALLKRKH